ncbi:FAD/NAD(P)-binding domain-containing protein [Daldinia vernicosa]|uniref:FAD/NAD(P)-binding domain-containing protein n=1 Tax=Daldinia vernicosa TaxID=114800 RepID=UPI0020073631|nr:FAD/NAD(P)-binding domain-containing protein [Daldinia vernicosa]KAI0854208.1 FAD/NAD(P)-binding domain-containing protein [Daldinia vernicosa]
MPLKIIICGSGIGGLSAAGYLRAKHHVTILERGTLDFTVNDYGMSIVSNAFNLLQRAGINPQNLDMVVPTHVWRRTPNNEEGKTSHFDTRARFKGAPSVLVKRAKLQGELMRFATSPEFAGAPAEVIQNAKVTKVDTAAGKVWTEDGRLFEGDLIIGADGINSVVRAAILGDQDISASVKTYDSLAFMTQLSIEDIRSDPSFDYLSDPATQAGLASAQASSGPQVNKHIIAYHTSLNSLQVFGYTSEKEFSEQFDSAKTAIIKDVPASRVIEEFAPEFGEGFINLFRHNTKIDAWRIRDVAAMDNWFSGKALLIGDAAHAVTPLAGQGSNMTIEDAEALGYLLRDVDSPDAIPDILRKFMSLRKDRVDLVRRRSHEIGGIQEEGHEGRKRISPEEFARKIDTYQGVEQALNGPKHPGRGRHPK